jgi:hypothetical protein
MTLPVGVIGDLIDGEEQLLRHSVRGFLGYTAKKAACFQPAELKNTRQGFGHRGLSGYSVRGAFSSGAQRWLAIRIGIPIYS